MKQAGYNTGGRGQLKQTNLYLLIFYFTSVFKTYKSI
jgi:hypothetical protein